MKINVIGLGHVGLPTAILLANKKNVVIGSDVNQNLIRDLKNKNSELNDNELNSLYLLRANTNLFFEPKPVTADMHIIAVPTPFIEATKKVDLTFINGVLDQLVSLEQEEIFVVIESTISPGTVAILSQKYANSKKKIIFAHSPERVLPGNTYHELVNNNRTIGANNIEEFRIIKSVYEEITNGEIIYTDILTAELSKVLENTYRDINIAFANEIAIICRKLNLDVNNVIQIANRHPRVNILSPGPGVGGHCIPVDPWFLVGDFPDDTKLIRAARNVNDNMPIYIVNRIIDLIDIHDLKLNDVGLYGLTYKENINDFRESPSLKILELINNQKGVLLKSFDPYNYDKENLDISFENFMSGIKLIVILVNHEHLYRNLYSIEQKIVFDTKNSIKSEKVIKL